MANSGPSCPFASFDGFEDSVSIRGAESVARSVTTAALRFLDAADWFFGA